MNDIIRKSFVSSKFVLISQVVILLFGLFKAILVPYILDINDYGYWQIYLFYTSYVGILALGFNDGVYLRYGGFQYEDLPHDRLRSAIRISIIVLLSFSLLSVLISLLFFDSERLFVFLAISGNILVLGINGVLVYIFQITNQMKKYSLFSIIPVLLVMGSISILFFLNDANFHTFITVDFLSKIISVVVMLFSARLLFFGHNVQYKEAVKEYTSNVSVGSKLMLAQLSGMLITGIGRIIVEILGNIEDYAFYSFGITITNLILVLITTVSLVAYPTLKRLNIESYPFYFDKINVMLRAFSFLAPIFYFGSVILINFFLPKYSPSIIYLNILFAVVFVQAKIQLLINTFYKVLRKEKEMLIANFSLVIVYIIVATLLFYLTKNVWILAVCTLAVMIWRCYASEIFIRKNLSFSNYKELIFDIAYLVVFVLYSSLLEIRYSLIIYLVSVIIVGTIYRKKILFAMSKLLKFISKS